MGLWVAFGALAVCVLASTYFIWSEHRIDDTDEDY